MNLKELLSQVRIEIGNNKIQKAIELLNSMKTNLPKLDSGKLLLIKSGFKQIADDKSNGVITNDQFLLERNKLIKSVIDFCAEIENELPVEENADVPSLTPLSGPELLAFYSNEKLLEDEIGFSGMDRIPQVQVLEDYDFTKVGYEDVRIILDEESAVYEYPSTLKTKAKALESFRKENKGGKVLYNSSTTRLNKVKIVEDGLEIFISKATYFEYLGTNYSMDLKLKGWSKSLRESFHKAGALRPLSESLFANHIGIGVLVFTSDNFLILQLRDVKNVSIYGGEVAPSVSGASEFKDFSLTRQSYLINFIKREAEEELGIDVYCFEKDSIRLLGIVRELNRGGKPEMFFMARLNIDYDELKAKASDVRDAWEREDIMGFEIDPDVDVQKPWENQEEIDNTLLNIKAEFGKLSLPLVTNLLLWRNFGK